MANPMKAIKAVKNFTGGKKGRAIENKVRKEFGMSKGGITAGKAKVNRKVEKLDTIAEGRTGGNLSYIYKKGKLIERFENHPPIKTKPRALTKRINQMAPSSKKTTKSFNKIQKKYGNAIKPNASMFATVPKVPVKVPKVPVKRRSK